MTNIHLKLESNRTKAKMQQDGARAAPRDLAEALLRSVARQKKGLNIATRLWRAVDRIFPEQGRELMLPIEEAMGGRISWKHIDALSHRLTVETEQYVSENVWDGPTVPGASGKIEFDALKLNIDSEKMSEIYNAMGDALQEARASLTYGSKKRWRPPPTKSRKKVLDFCRFCWRITTLTKKRMAFCPDHVSGTSAYLKATRVYRWRPKSANGDHYTNPYLFRSEERLREVFPNAVSLRAPLPTAIAEILMGGEVAVDEIEPHTVPLMAIWSNLPQLARYLKDKYLWDFGDARAVLQVLDPIDNRAPELHQKVHEAMARDQRLLLGMLVRAEAWLIADWAHDRCYGGAHQRYTNIPFL